MQQGENDLMPGLNNPIQEAFVLNLDLPALNNQMGQNNLPDLNMNPEEQAPISMVMDIFGQTNGISEASVNQPMGEENVEIVVDLPVQPVNFLHLQIQPEELNAVSASDHSEQLMSDVPINLNSDMGEQGDQVIENANQNRGMEFCHGKIEDNGNLQVGMVLLPKNLDVDPGLNNMYGNNEGYSDWVSQQNAERVRIWAQFFAPMGMAEGVSIPQSWADFFTLALMNPAMFDWAKCFLTSNAWNLRLKDRSSEAIVSFSIPNRCPVQEKTQCHNIVIEEMDVSDSESVEVRGEDQIQRKAPIAQ
jgi:hypothetical protein